MKVRDVMTTGVVTGSPETTFQEVVDLLVRHDISGLPIVEQGGRLAGVVTEADLVSKEAYGGRRRRRLLDLLADVVAGGETRWEVKAKGRTAGELMTSDVTTARPDEDLRVASRRMVEEGRKRLPVVDGERRVVGILSRADVIRALHRSDDDLEDAIAELLADPMRVPEGLDVKAAVHDGEVELWGTVRFPMDVPVLTSVVWQVPGVVDVRNETEAREADPQPR